MILHGQIESSKGKLTIYTNCCWVEIRLDGKIIWERRADSGPWYDKQHKPIADGLITFGELLRSLGVCK